MALALTDCVVPAVDGEQAAACDGDGCWYAKVRESVGGDVGDGRVGGELEHHDDVLLHLILKHQGALGKETLVRQTEREREKEGIKGGGGGIGDGGVRGEGQEKGEGGNGDGGEKGGGDRTDGTEGGRYISGRTGSKQVHTLRGEGLSTEGVGGWGRGTGWWEGSGLMGVWVGMDGSDAGTLRSCAV